jgi:hypothetical protein
LDVCCPFTAETHTSNLVKTVAIKLELIVWSDRLQRFHRELQNRLVHGQKLDLERTSVWYWISPNDALAILRQLQRKGKLRQSARPGVGLM